MITSSLLNFSLNIDYFSEFLFFTTRAPSTCIRFCLKIEIDFFSPVFKKSASTSCVFTRFCPREKAENVTIFYRSMRIYCTGIKHCDVIVFKNLRVERREKRPSPVSRLQSRAWSFAFLARFARWTKKKEILLVV